jgi:hypothetical protein
MINHDNKPIKHLADAKLCPNAPPDVRKQALMYLAGKKAGGALVMEFTTSEPSNGVTPAERSTDVMSTGDGSTQIVAVKKWKTGTLSGMVDYLLSEE